MRPERPFQENQDSLREARVAGRGYPAVSASSAQSQFSRPRRNEASMRSDRSE